jgi:hypothetical protein
MGNLRDDGIIFIDIEDKGPTVDDGIKHVPVRKIPRKYRDAEEAMKEIKLEEAPGLTNEELRDLQNLEDDVVKFSDTGEDDVYV